MAKELLGKYLIRKTDDGIIAAKVVEVEAYRGSDDPASHAFKGMTERNKVMFGEPGHAYVYFTYGMHFCLNVKTGHTGIPGAVLIRAVEIIDGLELAGRNRKTASSSELSNGPGKLTKAMNITNAHNGLDLVKSDELYLCELEENMKLQISASGQEIYALLRRRARELGYSEKKNISRAFAELNRLAGRLQIRKLIKVRAEIIYRKAQKEGLVQGRSILGAAAAAIYAACREGGTPITLREISEVSLSNKKEIARDYRLFCKELGLQIRSVDSVAFFSKIAEGAKISNAAQGLAHTLLKGAKNKRYCSGKHPSGLVASALHIASLRCSEKKTKKEISEAAGVSDTTVRHNCIVLRKIYAGECCKED